MIQLINHLIKNFPLQLYYEALTKAGNESETVFFSFSSLILRLALNLSTTGNPQELVVKVVR